MPILHVKMAGLGKRTGKPQRGKGHRPGPNKKARGGGFGLAGVRSGRDDQPKGPARVLAKENNSKLKRAEQRAERFGRGFVRKKPAATETHTKVIGTKVDDAVSDSGSASGSEGGDDREEEGPHSSYNRLMQALKKNAGESDDDDEKADEDDEDDDDDEDDEDDEDDAEDEDGEELEWEEVSSNDEEEGDVGDEDEDDDDEDDDAEELGGAGRSKSSRRAQGKEDDPEADRDELGLDADAPESADDDDEYEEVAAVGKTGSKAAAAAAAAEAAAASAVPAKGGFEEYFDVAVSAEQAEETEKVSVGGKWKKIESLLPTAPGVLWRKGLFSCDL